MKAVFIFIGKFLLGTIFTLFGISELIDVMKVARGEEDIDKL